jgi:hypothetical protein
MLAVGFKLATIISLIGSSIQILIPAMGLSSTSRDDRSRVIINK